MISAATLFFRDILRGYSFVLFIDRAKAGAAFLLATMLAPMAGLTGLLAAIVGATTARWFSLPRHLMPLYVCNSLLVGLSLGVVRPLDGSLAVMVCITAVTAVWLTVNLHAWLWRLDRLPALSGAFVLVALVAGMAIGGDGTRLQANPDLMRLFGEPLDPLLVAFGSAFFSPYPLSGLMILAVLFLVSPFLAATASCGFVLGHTLFLLWADVGTELAARWGGFNFILTTIALSGVFVVPSRRAFALAMAGVAFASLLTVAGLNLFLSHGLPVLAAPFLLSTWLILATLRRRESTASPEAALEQPGPPEVLWERARLARARGVGLDSVPLTTPFFGEWRVCQAFDGPHTHQGLWHHAFDFDISGEACFGVPILSPVTGQIIACRDDLPDNPTGEMNLTENWGNYLLIRLFPGRAVLLAHLKQNSLRVRAGETVLSGQQVAACGNSGRSATSHLHLHVQEGEALGCPTIPCHLIGVNVNEGETSNFHLAVQPRMGVQVGTPSCKGQLAQALHLPSGMTMTWRWRCGEEAWQSRTLQSRISLLGQRYILCGSASIEYEETQGLLAFFDHTGPPDEFFDLWCLALGLTPLSETVCHWKDEPPAQLFPMRTWERAFLFLSHPLGAAIESHYQRFWDDSAQIWHQTGEHRIPGSTTELRLEAGLSPVAGCTWLTASRGTRHWRAELITVDRKEDTP